ncbi:hypothetical protein [Pseudomonas canadensis]|uniref:hypothetical protein n=1 Tax=Pseudomonas canadensis TaxID=915099 RepID=UPI001617E84F|nr:hypothetical protein [Pseudomonas canadensis]
MIEYPMMLLRVETDLAESAGRQANTGAYVKPQQNKLESWLRLFVRRFPEWLPRWV